MFKKEGGSDEIETIIGPSVHVEGDFSAAGDVVVEGVVSGKMQTEKSLRVGPEAKIFANISAASALIAGEVQGNIKVHGGLELTTTAKVFGDIICGTLTMATGASLHGRCQAGAETRARVEKIEDRLKLKEKALEVAAVKVK